MEHFTTRSPLWRSWPVECLLADCRLYPLLVKCLRLNSSLIERKQHRICPNSSFRKLLSQVSLLLESCLFRMKHCLNNKNRKKWPFSRSLITSSSKPDNKRKWGKQELEKKQQIFSFIYKITISHAKVVTTIIINRKLVLFFSNR